MSHKFMTRKLAVKKPCTIGHSPSDWLEERDLESSLSILDDLATRHALLGGEIGLQIVNLIKAHDYARLISFDLRQNSPGWNVSHLMECRQALAFYQKLEPLPVETEKEAVAYNAFMVSELKCQETNDFFRALKAGKVTLMPRLAKHLYNAKRKIARVLGPCPKISDLKLMFGPGSTTTIKKESANPQAKLAETPTCSELLFHSGYLPSLLREMPHWLAEHCDNVCIIDGEGNGYYELEVVTHHGKLQFVPKNAKTYRAIDVQPTLNTLLQGGLGRWMKRRLRLAGIDITDQSKNQRMARDGSITNRLATLDLTSASDSVAIELVRFLLDEDWYALLRAASTGATLYKGKSITLEKFMSMGNGFTFPLETLIFWALTASVCENEVQEVSCYGDDIICPSHRAEEVIEVLEECGFRVGKAKSFVKGPFRESCGADFYMGIDVRPYYQKTLVTGETLFTLHNFYIRRGQYDLAAVVLGHIHQDLQIFGPDGYGDGHLLREDWTGYRTRVMRRAGYGGVLFETYQREPKKIANLWPGDYVTPLYAVYARETGNFLRDVETSWIQYCYDWEPGSVHEFLENGRVLWPTPGAETYRKVSIYTFALR